MKLFVSHMFYTTGLVSSTDRYITYVAT